MDSSGEDAPSSRNVRPSTRSRRGRQGSGQSPCSTSPARTRRADAAQESSESGSPESEALDGGSHHSRGLSVPNEEHPKLPSPREEGAPSDSGARWQRQPASAASEEHQRPAQPRPVVAHRMGTSPPRVHRLLVCGDASGAGAPAAHCRARNNTPASLTPRVKPAPRGRRGAC